MKACWLWWKAAHAQMRIGATTPRMDIRGRCLNENRSSCTLSPSSWRLQILLAKSDHLNSSAFTFWLFVALWQKHLQEDGACFVLCIYCTAIHQSESSTYNFNYAFYLFYYFFLPSHIEMCLIHRGIRN